MDDFLSIDNLKIIFDILQKYFRDKHNYEIKLLDHKKTIYKMMDAIHQKYEHTKNKNQANKILIKHMIKNIEKKLTKDTFDTDFKIDIDYEPYERPEPELIEKPKENDKLIKNEFKRIITEREDFKNYNNENIIINKVEDPQSLYNDVLVDRKSKFKDIDENKPPEQINEELIIPAPEINKHIYDKYYNRKVLTKYITIDSRDRNVDLYQKSNYYKVNLKEPLHNIMTAELISAEIPNTQYLINDTNNILYFQETNVQISNKSYYSFSITPGNYDLADLAPLLESGLNANGDSTYYVTFDSDSKFTISSDTTGGDGIFVLIFNGGTDIDTKYKENSIGPVLGYDVFDKTGSSSYTSDFVGNVNFERYVFLYISKMENIENISNIPNEDKFAQIYLESDRGKYTYYKRARKELEYHHKLKVFDKPETLSTLLIQVRDYAGNLIDFNGFDHSFVIRLEQLNINSNIEILRNDMIL